MEFEIEEGEELLFDGSTNPSLLRKEGPVWSGSRPVPRRQRAVVFPEEEHQLG